MAPSFEKNFTYLIEPCRSAKNGDVHLTPHQLQRERSNVLRFLYMCVCTYVYHKQKTVIRANERANIVMGKIVGHAAESRGKPTWRDAGGDDLHFGTGSGERNIAAASLIVG